MKSLQQIKQTICKYWEKILTVIGDIKIYKTPLYVLYSNEEYDYKMRGDNIDELRKLLQPGDIILRHYDHYLDSFLIPGYYSHSGIYDGEEIVHAVAEGVKKIHVIDFCQCDGIKVLRLTNKPDEFETKLIEELLKVVGKPYDFYFNNNTSSEFYCHEMTATVLGNVTGIKFETFKYFGADRFTAESFENSEHVETIYECRR